ncbi:hypothetical protein Agabi119p4_5011 [Agaricus bisporus var. burnettii]|uniref:Uncharacterized protein n=1 Tax=Agaricus bisporus var. burnettii TaxID=192524 RepID=A0A8H7F4J6_AGABI|nr:hypothetical protein Agabi119p4_5011 [Agaricus bisporus var. burnettii]
MVIVLNSSQIPSNPEIYCTGASLSRETILLSLATLSQTDREEVNSLIRDQGEISLEELADALAVSSVPISFHSFELPPLLYPTATPPPSPVATPIIDPTMDSANVNARSDVPLTNLPTYQETEEFIHSPEWILRALFAVPDIVKQTHLLEHIIQNRVHHFLNRTYGDLGRQLATGDSTLEKDNTKNVLHYYTNCCASAQRKENDRVTGLQNPDPCWNNYSA